jgi:LPS-assembly lipoprotein
MNIGRRKLNIGRALLLAGLAIPLGACGFHPLYGSYVAGSALGNTLSSIYVEPITDYTVAHTGYELRTALASSLNSDENARYRLKVTMNQATEGIALETDASITRYNTTFTVHYTLTDTVTNKVVKTGVESGLSAYNVATSPYATLIAQQDADKREAQDIAQRLTLELGVFFEQRQKKLR